MQANGHSIQSRPFLGTSPKDDPSIRKSLCISLYDDSYCGQHFISIAIIRNRIVIYPVIFVDVTKRQVIYPVFFSFTKGYPL